MATVPDPKNVEKVGFEILSKIKVKKKPKKQSIDVSPPPGKTDQVMNKQPLPRTVRKELPQQKTNNSSRHDE